MGLRDVGDINWRIYFGSEPPCLSCRVFLLDIYVYRLNTSRELFASIVLVTHPIQSNTLHIFDGGLRIDTTECQVL